MSANKNHPILAAGLIVIIAMSGLGIYLYQNGYFAIYSAGVISCTTYTDVTSGTPSESCSSLQAIPLQPQSVIADGVTLYDTNPASPTYGRSSPLVKDARITLSAGAANPIGITGTFTCSALVDGQNMASVTNTTTFSSVPNNAKVCAISIEGHTLQTQYYNPSVSTHVVSMTFIGKFTSIFATGATQSRSFSGSLGNVTVTITGMTNGTSSSSSDITVNNENIGISGGGGSVLYSSSTDVTGPTAPLTQITEYSEQTTEIIQQTDSYSSPLTVNVDGTSIDVPSGAVGSTSYSPDGTGGGTVTTTVTESDKVIYERDAANTAQMFGGYENTTPYVRCVYWSQC